MYEIEFSQTTNHGLWVLPIPKPEYIDETGGGFNIEKFQFFRYSDWKKFSINPLTGIVNSYTDDPYYLPNENDKSYNVYIRTICPAFSGRSNSTLSGNYDSETNIAKFNLDYLNYEYDYNQEKIISLEYIGNYGLGVLNKNMENIINYYFPINLILKGSSGFDMSSIRALADIKESVKQYNYLGKIKFATFGELFSYDGINLDGPDNSFYTIRNSPERTIDFQGIKITPKNVFGSNFLHVVDGSYPDNTYESATPDVTYIHKIKGYDLADFIFEGKNRVTAASPKLYNSHFEYYDFTPGGWSNKYFSFIWEIVISHN